MRGKGRKSEREREREGLRVVGRVRCDLDKREQMCFGYVHTSSSSLATVVVSSFKEFMLFQRPIIIS